MPEPDVLSAADANMVAYWRALLRVSPASASTTLEGVELSASGVPVALFNRAIAVGPVRDAPAVAEAIVAFYSEAAVPFGIFVRDEVAPGLSEACLAAGLESVRDVPIMVMDPIGPAPPLPDGLTVTVVDASTIDQLADVMADGFGMPRDVAHTFCGPALLSIDGCTAFLGVLDGEPVGASTLFRSAGLAGVYGVTTLAGHRGRGVGAAVTWAAVTRGAALGDRVAILQASDMGRPVYQAMGFTTRAAYRELRSPASGS